MHSVPAYAVAALFALTVIVEYLPVIARPARAGLRAAATTSIAATSAALQPAARTMGPSLRAGDLLNRAGAHETNLSAALATGNA